MWLSLNSLLWPLRGLVLPYLQSQQQEGCHLLDMENMKSGKMSQRRLHLKCALRDRTGFPPGRDGRKGNSMSKNVTYYERLKVWALEWEGTPVLPLFSSIHDSTPLAQHPSSLFCCIILLYIPAQVGGKAFCILLYIIFFFLGIKNSSPLMKHILVLSFVKCWKPMPKNISCVMAKTMPVYLLCIPPVLNTVFLA